jgi:hypothetical protein
MFRMVFFVRNAIFNFVPRNSLIVSLPLYMNVAFFFLFCVSVYGFCFRFFCMVLFMFISYSLLYFFLYFLLPRLRGKCVVVYT